jgi:hypothetical protein
MTEILIGRQLLKAIGFDLEAHLETNHEILNNSAFDTHLLNTVNTRSVKQLVLLTPDSDPVPPTETAGAPIGTDSASEIQEAIGRMTASDKFKGMSSVGLSISS